MRQWLLSGCARLAARMGLSAAGLCGILTCSALSAAAQESGPLHVYLSADQTGAHATGSSLHRGLEAGLRAGATRFDVPEIRILVRDHKNNLRRTGHTIDEALSDPSTLAIMGGMHTPHYLRHGPRLNAEGLVLLLPWSSGAALTRLGLGADNYIFRLSLDDRNTAPFLARQSAGAGCARIAVLALSNGWGEQNAAAMVSELDKHGVDTLPTIWVREEAEKETLRFFVEDLRTAAPDCVIFVLSARVGALAASVLATWDAPPKVFSHWGVLGGGFETTVSDAMWRHIDMSVLATCHFDALRAPKDGASAPHAEARAILRSGSIEMPMAFVHAYDLSLVMLAAVEQARTDPRWSAGQQPRWAALRDALEALETPVDGLLKRYETPFAPVTDAASHSHEALHAGDLCLGEMRPDGRLVEAGGIADP
ncbi:MAG: ABC transporter substrate-binding protein [Pseudomonadota bacterium]